MNDRIWEWDKRKVIPVWACSLVLFALIGRCTATFSPSNDDDATSQTIYKGTRLERLCKNGMELYVFDGSLWTRTKEFNRVFLPKTMTADQFCEKKE